MGGLAREERRRWGVGAVVILALGGLAIAVIVGIVRGAGSAQSLAPAPVTVATASTSLYVHVSGAVNAPGLYVLHADARVVDAVAAAGGLAEALKDEKIREYLGKKDLFVYTVGFDEGKVYVNKIILDGEEVKLEKIAEYQVTLEHADLLNRSLKDRSVTFA